MIIETISIEISKEKVYDINNIIEKEEIFQNGKFRNDKYDYI
jgi:hypothetical protein